MEENRALEEVDCKSQQGNMMMMMTRIIMERVEITGNKKH